MFKLTSISCSAHSIIRFKMAALWGISKLIKSTVASNLDQLHACNFYIIPIPILYLNLYLLRFSKIAQQNNIAFVSFLLSCVTCRQMVNTIYSKCREGRWLVYENITSFLKNHWTKHRQVCTHFDPFSMLITNMDIIFYNSEIFDNFLRKIWCRLSRRPRAES